MGECITWYTIFLTALLSKQTAEKKSNMDVSGELAGTKKWNVDIHHEQDAGVMVLENNVYRSGIGMG